MLCDSVPTNDYAQLSKALANLIAHGTSDATLLDGKLLVTFSTMLGSSQAQHPDNASLVGYAVSSLAKRLKTVFPPPASWSSMS